MLLFTVLLSFQISAKKLIHGNRFLLFDCFQGSIQDFCSGIALPFPLSSPSLLRRKAAFFIQLVSLGSAVSNSQRVCAEPGR